MSMVRYPPQVSSGAPGHGMSHLPAPSFCSGCNRQPGVKKLGSLSLDIRSNDEYIIVNNCLLHGFKTMQYVLNKCEVRFQANQIVSVLSLICESVIGLLKVSMKFCGNLHSIQKRGLLAPYPFVVLREMSSLLTLSWGCALPCSCPPAGGSRRSTPPRTADPRRWSQSGGSGPHTWPIAAQYCHQSTNSSSVLSPANQQQLSIVISQPIAAQ